MRIGLRVTASLAIVSACSSACNAAQFDSLDEVVVAIAQLEAANPSWDAARIVTGLRKLTYDSESWDSLIADRSTVAALQAGNSGLTERQLAQFGDAAGAENAVPVPSTHSNDTALDIAHIWVGIEVVLFPRLGGDMALALGDYGSAPTATWGGDVGSAVVEHALSSTASCGDDFGCYLEVFSSSEDLLAGLDGLAIGHGATTGNYTGRLSWWLETYYSGAANVPAAAADAGEYDPDPVFQLGVLCRATLVARAQGWGFGAGGGVTNASIAEMRRQIQQIASLEALRRGGAVVSEANVNTAAGTLVSLLEDIKASEPAACSATASSAYTAQPTPPPSPAPTPAPALAAAQSTAPSVSAPSPSPSTAGSLPSPPPPTSASRGNADTDTDTADPGPSASSDGGGSMAVVLVVVIVVLLIAGAAIVAKRRRSNFDGGQSRPNAFFNPTYGVEGAADDRSAGLILQPDHSAGLILHPVPFGADFLHANPNQPPWKTDFTSAEIHTV